MSKSCGCKTEKEYKINPLNLEDTNRRNLGDWKVVEEISAERNEKQEIKRTVKVKCKCGYEKITNYDNIGNSKSCFKCSMEKRKEEHAQYIEKHPLIKNIQSRYRKIKNRCYNKNSDDYKYYGAKGITMCDEWLNDFNAFYEWSLNNNFSKDKEIDRIDNNKGYSPDNCNYISKEENLLKMSCVGLTLEDVAFIRSPEFNLDDCDKYGYKRTVAKNIMLYKTFKNL